MNRGPVGERGSATIWVVACCALLVLVAAVAATRSLAVLARHRAESAADLAALAAAGQIGVSDRGCALAAQIARDSGGSLRWCSVRLGADGRSGTVTVRVALTVRLPIVRVQTVIASARAARLSGAPLAHR